MMLQRSQCKISVCFDPVLSAIPRLSAAITTPSLNLIATTDVPVTIGDCVCWFGRDV